jgi:membrane protein YqaA with SNARE-associated domain
MGRFVAGIRALALSLGAPGLFLVALLDSSILSLPEVADLLVVWMVTKHHDRLWLYVIAAVAGSLCGCLVLYGIGRKGGDALVRKRFAGPLVERAMATFQRYGVLAVLVPSLLPPPAPFKIFVLLAGVTGISAGRFALAILIGRGLRYLTLALLAVEYGDVALAYMEAHGVALSLGAIGLIAVGFVLYLLWTRYARAKQGTNFVS